MLCFVESKSDIPGHKFFTYFHFKVTEKKYYPKLFLLFIGYIYISQSTLTMKTLDMHLVYVRNDRPVTENVLGPNFLSYRNTRKCS